MEKEEIKKRFEDFQKISHPKANASIVDADLSANLNLSETQLAGLITTYLSTQLDAREKKIFENIKGDIIESIKLLPANSIEYTDYYNKLVMIANMVSESL